MNSDPHKPKSSFIKKITHEQKFLVSSALYSRISAEALAKLNVIIEANPELVAALEDAPVEHRRRELVRLGNYYLPEIFNKETGLSTFNPPSYVHAMVRDPGYCGDLYYVDLITETLDAVGSGIQAQQKILDFGCSSGRVLKTLTAVYPETEFYGCDPNSEAITWAAENMPQAQFFVSAESPPLKVETASFDLVYAISIWSHFHENSGLAWMQEIQRILKPGAYFIWTTHGLGSLTYYWKNKAMSGVDAQLIEAELERTGFYFIDAFRGRDDWGVGKVNWGQTFINPSYVLKYMLPFGWRLCSYAHRRSEGNQDVYLFQKL